MAPQPANGGIATRPRNRRDILNRLLMQVRVTGCLRLAAEMGAPISAANHYSTGPFTRPSLW